MTFERTEFIHESLASLLSNKKNFNFNLIISDNSKTNNVNNFLKKFFPEIKYIKYDFSEINSQTKHFNEIIKNNNSKYIMMFHDDDILSEISIEIIYKYLLTSEDIVCVAPNSYKIKNNKIIYSRINRMKEDHLIFKKKK